MKFKMMALMIALPTLSQSGELYMEGGLAHQFRHGSCGQPYTYCTWDRNFYKPALAHLEFGISQEFTNRLSGSIFVRHESLPTVNDYGVNQFGVSLKLSLLKF